MNQHFQDAMALAWHYQSFDLFITFTCNLLWPEITNELLPSQNCPDCPDLTIHVFNIYKTSLVNDLTKRSILGDTQEYVYTIEFQKHSLPHMHLLLSLSSYSQPMNSDQVDTLITATWPDPMQQPLLFNIVKCYMVHGSYVSTNLCAPCIKDGKCTKHYPKQFQSETVLNSKGYPSYAHPNNGCAYEVHNFMANNRWIVPYNPYILAWWVMKMSLHIVTWPVYSYIDSQLQCTYQHWMCYVTCYYQIHNEIYTQRSWQSNNANSTMQ